MSQNMRDKLRKERGTPIYVYDANTLNLLHIFYSKVHIYNSISIHHKTLRNSLDLGILYLDYFLLSLDLLDKFKTNLLSSDELNALVVTKRKLHLLNHPSSKPILAEFKDNPSMNLEFESLDSLAKHLKGDRQVIRSYLTGVKSGYYRGKWKFTLKANNI